MILQCLNGKYRLYKSSIVSFILLILVLFHVLPIASAEERWIGTWVSAQQLTEFRNLPPEPGLSNNTLRQVIRPTLGGRQLRAQFSNIYGSSPVTINAVHLAVSKGGDAIDAATDKTLSFDGASSITIPAGKALYSDTLDFNVAPLKNLAVSIYFGQTSPDVTGHPGSRTTSYIQDGNTVTAADMSSAVKTEHWYILSGIDLRLNDSYACVVTLGDSITDGRGSTTNANNRWPDNLANRFQANPKTAKIGVLNQGIGGNTMVRGGLGPTALKRFERDVLEQNGLRWVIILEGVNDIGGSRSRKVAAELIAAYEQLIEKAHTKDILVYGVPILPFGGSFYDSPDHEASRQTVNNWIRSSGKFDAVIDLDAVVRNPEDPNRLLTKYDSGDHLHLSPAGYQKMAEAIDLSLFKMSFITTDANNSSMEQPKVDTFKALPAISELLSIPKLPDPFKFTNGKRMTHRDEWPRRRLEISRLVQEYVYGPKPPKPAMVTGSLSNNRLTVNCAEDGRSISFSVRIAYPPTGTAPYPAIISIGPWLTLPKSELDNLGIAIIYFPNDELGRQGGRRDRGRGKFYDLYGSDHQAGSLMAWAWGVSRLIDVLEQTPEAHINPTKLGVTGCSRNGKGALVCGAFDERIAVTIPTESGSGGASSWRVADAMLASGKNVQTARQIVTENTWMSPVFSQFGNRVDKLPVDQHMVAALCAPRPLLITENTAIEWLGPEACYTTAIAAHKVWQALGVPDRMGFVQTSHGDHCRFKEIDELRAFCTAFLLDVKAETHVLKTDGNFDLDPADWINWDVPALE